MAVPNNYRAAIATSSESVQELATRYHVSTRTVQRIIERFEATGNANRLPKAGGRPLALDDTQQVAFLWFALLFQDASRSAQL